MSTPVFSLAQELRAATPPSPAGEREFLSMQEVADLLGVPITTFRMWRSRGIGTSSNFGPVGIALGRRVIFRRVDVNAWLDSMAEAS